MVKCSNCGVENAEGSVFCHGCGMNFENGEIKAQNVHQAQEPQYVTHRKVYSLWSVLSALGMATSIAGIFWVSILLLPLGFAFSYKGYKEENTRGVAVAGIVISIVATIVWLGVTANRQNWVPYWLVRGIW